MDAYAPIPGKCKWWREKISDEDRLSPRLKPGQYRVECTCFVEGDYWNFTVDELPSECPNFRACRYYIKHT
ncbi:MAG: hypothetical protein Q8K89_11930 [Actinomycetota bacterium]|nr:hypothetical protein [Actinomycetota bacterium]